MISLQTTITLCLITILLQFHNSSQTSLEAQRCSPFSCSQHKKDAIRFPFHVPRNQTNRCGYPGFDLTCCRDGQTLVNISSKPFIVSGIYYADQLLFLSDPNACMPNQVLNLNLTSTPYTYEPDTLTYTYLNCSRTNVTNVDNLPIGTSVVGCLSGGDYTVMMAFERASEKKLVDEMKCRVVNRVNAAFWWPEEMMEGNYPVDMSDALLKLTWNLPNCGDCSLRGGICGFANHSGLNVDCFFSPNYVETTQSTITEDGVQTQASGLPKSAEYALILGAGIPIFLCMIGLSLYITSKVRARNQIRRYTISSESSLSIFHRPVILTVGLDSATIESYPKTILGESKRLPRASDSTCPICLSEYQPTETLRSIPECNHFFHADCIDEWLRMNASCPLCRKSPQQPYGGSG